MEPGDRADRYATDKSYAWNYEHPPAGAMSGTPPLEPAPGVWTFCGIPVDSPLGVAAGPLLNGAWCLYYARLGFDVVTYKTVRSQQRDCYAQPNLSFVDTGMMDGHESEVCEAAEATRSWAVSFGMPSQAPEVWQPDVSAARAQLQSLAGKGMPGRRPPLLSVSVVATVDEGARLEQLADDYARCAAMAAAAGADTVEANFSCPNVSTCDGQLYQQPEAAATVAERLREAVGATPLIVKIGHFLRPQEGWPLVEALAPHVDAVAATNSVGARVRGQGGQRLFAGQSRGICGEACRDASLRQVQSLCDFLDRRRLPLRVIGVGGVFRAAHVRQYLDAGAEAVQLATAVMLDPQVAVAIRRSGLG